MADTGTNTAPTSTPDAQSWIAAAGQPAPPSAAPTTTPAATATIPQNPVQPAPSTPVVLTPVKRGGILGVVDSLADALVGHSRPELATDQAGNKYVKETTLSHGQQWARIGAEAMQGAAAGLAAGRGGRFGNAAFAGVQTGQQIGAQRPNVANLTAEAQKENLANANYQMVQQNLAQGAWKFAREKTKATQEDINFAENQIKQIEADGGQLLGTAAHVGDIAGILKVNPDVMEDLVKRQIIRIKPYYNEDGTGAGFKAYKMPDRSSSQLLPPGTAFSAFNRTTGQIEEHHASDPITVKDRDTWNDQAQAQALAFRNAQTDAKHKDLENQNVQSEIHARETELPGKLRQTAAETRRANTEADVAEKKMKETGSNDELADMIGTGQIPVDRMGYLLARNPDLVQKVIEKHRDFDPTKVGNYVQVYHDLTSTKPGSGGDRLITLGTALEHLQNLHDLNTVKSRIPGTTDYQTYENQLETVAPELAKFYGDSTIPGIEAMKKTLGATFNRDAAIRKQVNSLGERYDNYKQQWDNAAPSAEYKQKFPAMNPKAERARAALDSAYKPEGGGEAQYQYKTADGKQGWDGTKWVTIPPAAK